MSFNYTFHFALPIKALKVLGFWPTNESSRKYRLWGFVSFLIFLTIFFVLSLILLVKFKRYEETAMNFVIVYLATMFKVLNLIYYLNSVKNLLRELTDLIEFTKSELDTARFELQKHVKFMVLLVFLFGLLVFSVILDLIVPFYEYRLPYPMWIPYNYDNEFIFWITSFVQIAISAASFIIVISVELIPVFFMGMAATILGELRERMQLISEGGKTDDVKYKELVKCIEIHLRTRNFVKKIENCFSITFFVQGFFSATSICFTVYTLSKVRIFLTCFV